LVSLGSLLGEARRILREVLHLAGFGIAGTQTRVLLGSPLSVFRRLSQHFGLGEPNVSVRWNLDNEGFTTFV
jgi:hypothetical protein